MVLGANDSCQCPCQISGTPANGSGFSLKRCNRDRAKTISASLKDEDTPAHDLVRCIAQNRHFLSTWALPAHQSR